MIIGIVNLTLVSAKVFPRQIRLPPKKGENASEFRGLPSEVFVHLLSGIEKSKRSGLNS